MRIIMVICVGLMSTLAWGQSVVDPNLRVQNWLGGLDRPTGFVFLDQNGTGLALEKNTGKVKLYQNRQFVKTALDLPVANSSEQGLLGMALSTKFATDKRVYLYYTAASQDGDVPIANAIKEYTWSPAKQKLIFSRKVHDLPATPGPSHNGGKLTFGRDGLLYAIVGDLNRESPTINLPGSFSDNGVILRFDVSAKPLMAYHASGIRNSFGIAVDPVTGDLWDTENGRNEFDEINRVPRGFNSGWKSIMGPVSRNGGETPELIAAINGSTYSDPEFSWKACVAPTDLEFFPTTRMGGKYKNDLFVGTTRGGKILHFDLTHTRKALRLEGDLADLVADNSSSNLFAEQSAHIFGENFGTVTDLLSGPGGMYVLSYTNGALYRITTNPSAPSAAMGIIVPEPVGTAVLLCVSILMLRSGGAARRWPVKATAPADRESEAGLIPRCSRHC